MNSLKFSFLALTLALSACASTGELSSTASSPDLSFASIPLQHSDAEDLAESLSELLADAHQVEGSIALSETRVMADEISNTLYVRGTPGRIAEIRVLVSKLDRAR